jgi:hypothetical protein
MARGNATSDGLFPPTIGADMSDAFPSTLFVYRRGGLGSAEIRGKQIAAELKSDTLTLVELTPQIARRYDVVVYVKQIGSKTLLDQIRTAGVKQVMDVVDNYSNWKIRRGAPYLDAFIGGNLTHAIRLQEVYGTRSVDIPHHHCNFNNLRIPARAGAPVIGYISGPDWWKANQRLAKKTGYKVLNNLSQRGPDGFDNMIDAYMATDIGFTYRMHPMKLRFNPATKLTNFMSFGIPSVMSPESGYLQYGRHGETVLYAHTEKDFVSMIRWLGEDTQLRQRMSDACYEAAKPFHIERIADRYRDFLRVL